MQRPSVRLLGSRVVLVPVLAALALTGCGGGSQDTVGDLPAPTYPPSPVAAAPRAQPAARDQVPVVTTPVRQAPVTATPAGQPAPVPATPAFDGLKPGDTGPQVAALQRRLSQLGFWVGDTDGTYGDTTSQAVLALQKAAGLGRDGVMGTATRQALASGVALSPRSSSGHWVEIDKTRQLAMFVDNGRVSTILNTSTGSNQPYSYGGRSYTANTPSGQYAVFRQVDHLDTGPLGDLWRPKYFDGGIALHGAAAVPAYPASHGCTRISNAAMNWVWSTGQAPIGTQVWVY